MAPGTLYRRALRRVDRRAQDGHRGRLLIEAVRLANRLAYIAGIAGPYADDRRFAPPEARNRL